ncbi:MAG: transmembrane 220 family protein [Gammaproteobacteria bacterium]|nr:transmembrane 220 family protein [Gammaproteobacteria bacterium]
MLFKTISYFMMAFFLMSLVVQFNDPDWLFWIMAYGAVLVTTVLKTFKPFPWLQWVLLILVLLYGYGVFQWSDNFAQTSLDAFKSVGMNDSVAENVRELWGLVICLVWTIVMVIHHFHNKLKLVTIT